MLDWRKDARHMGCATQAYSWSWASMRGPHIYNCFAVSWWHLVTDPQTTKSKIKPPYATLEDIISIWMHGIFNMVASMLDFRRNELQKPVPPRYPCYEQLAFGQSRCWFRPPYWRPGSQIIDVDLGEYWWPAMMDPWWLRHVKTQLKMLKSGVMRLALMLMPFFVWARPGVVLERAGDVAISTTENSHQQPKHLMRRLRMAGIIWVTQVSFIIFMLAMALGSAGGMAKGTDTNIIWLVVWNFF